MGKVGTRFVEGFDRKALRHGAVPEPGNLRKDEPEPVTRLPPAPKLIEHRLKCKVAADVHNFAESSR